MAAVAGGVVHLGGGKGQGARGRSVAVWTMWVSASRVRGVAAVAHLASAFHGLELAAAARRQSPVQRAWGPRVLLLVRGCSHPLMPRTPTSGKYGTLYDGQ